MKTNKNHNEALLDKIEKLNDQLEVSKSCMETAKKGDPVGDWHEAETWMLEQQISTAKEALINQELKNW